jgi:hypothetical protein
MRLRSEAVIVEKSIIKSNLEEALEEIARLIREIETDDPHFDEVALRVSLAHAYEHLNFAWNIRHKAVEEYKSLTDENYYAWRSFPREMWELWLPFKVPDPVYYDDTEESSGEALAPDEDVNKGK